MRTAFFLAAVGLVGSVAAQIPIPPFGSTFTGSLTRGYWFQAPTSFFISGLSVPNEAAQAFQVVEVIDFGATPPPVWPGVAPGTQLFYSNNTAAGTIISTAILIPAGNYIGVLGACTPTVGSNTSYNSYTNVLGPFASNILGMPTTLTRFGTQFGIGAGGNNPCWTEPQAAISRVEMYVSPPSPNFATNTSLGAGCISAFNSFYEHLPNATLAAPALTGNVLFLFPSGTGYQGVWSAGAAAAMFVPPVAALPVATGDDLTVAYTPTTPLSTPYGPQATLQVNGNAVIGFGAGALNFPGTSAWVPTSAGFLNSTIGGIYAWHDYNQAEAGSGPIVAEEVAGTLYITFNGVENYPAGVVNPSTMQFQLDLASGNVRIVWLTIDSNATSIDGSSHLVGVTAPGPSNNPVSVTLSTATQLVTMNPEVLPLTLTASTRPVTGTSWNLTTGNIPTTGVIGVEVFGFLDPGINDLGFLGMPSCGLRASLDALNAYAVTGTSHAYSLAIPNNPGLIGVDVFTTSAVFQMPPVNAFGAITSNGIQGHLGDL